MSKTKMLGGALAVVAAMLALGTASASASLPEFGQCVPAVPEKTGEYGSPACVKKAKEHKGRYNWKAGPPAKLKFSGVGENVEVETTSKRKITCGAAIYSGEYTGPKTEKATVDLVGCDDSVTEKSCQSNPINEGEIETPAPLEGEIGFITSGEKTVVGLDLKPTSPNPYLFAFECGSFPNSTVHETIEGSVIGVIGPQNRAAPEFKIAYRAKSGVQAVQAFEGGAKDTLISNITTGLETKSEATAFKGTWFNSNEEVMQIKSKEL